MFTFLVILSICFVLGLWFFRLYWVNIKVFYYTIINKITSPRALPLYDPEGKNFKILTIHNLDQINKDKIVEDMLNFKVAHIYLVHGTFVGSDPFDFVKYLERFESSFLSHLGKKLQSFGIKQSEKWLDDIGNFTDEYRQTLFDNLGKQFSISNFYWSSSNHHFARVEAAIELYFDIHKLVVKEKLYGQRILFMGHSHAGQLFALITQFLTNSFPNDLLKKSFHKFNMKKFKQVRYTLKTIQLDFVTLGTPVRYEFKQSKNIRILHITNHRGNTNYGGDWSGLIYSRDGDYIQQMGIAGSDAIIQIDELRQKNALFIPHLGPSYDLSHLKEALKEKKRIHPEGLNLLVDFEDNSKIPNFFKTLAGHGAYTQKKHIPHLICLLHKYLYNDKY